MRNQLPTVVTSAVTQLVAQAGLSSQHHRRISDERVLEALHWQARTGCPWRLLPKALPGKSTIFRRRALWLAAGIFDALLVGALAPTTSEQLIDATFIEVKSPLPERGWTKIGNGLKILALCAPDGAFSAVSCGSAGPGEARLAAALFEHVPAPRLLLADAAYDTRRLREALSKRDCRLLTTRPWPSRKIPLNTPDEIEYAGTSLADRAHLCLVEGLRRDRCLPGALARRLRRRARASHRNHQLANVMGTSSYRTGFGGFGGPNAGDSAPKRAKCPQNVRLLPFSGALNSWKRPETSS